MTRKFLDVTDDPDFSDPPEAGPTSPASTSADVDERRQSASADLSAAPQAEVGRLLFRTEGSTVVMRVRGSFQNVDVEMTAAEWREVVAGLLPVIAFAELAEVDAMQREVDRLSAALSDATARLESIKSRA